MLGSRRWLLSALAATAGAVAGCAGGSGSGDDPPPTPRPGATYAYPHLQPCGNRVLAGGGDPAGAAPVELDVDGRPAWLLGVDEGGASRWAVVSADGRATTHRVADGEAERLASHGAVTTPPVAAFADGEVGFLGRPADGSPLSPPVPVEGGRLYVADDGAIVVRRGEDATRLAVDAPADAVPIALGGGRYAVYGGRTERYRHGALGDVVEASTLVVVDAGRGRLVETVELPAPGVFEGLSPLAADLDGDVAPELVTTVSGPGEGARIRAYAADGTALADGPVHGSGWRHQLCAAALGPDGGTELAVVRKPHVERVIEFYRLDGDGLRVTATLAGYASHTYGSRDLDGGLAGDLDGDGRTELLVPTTDRTRLAGVRRTDAGATEAWSLPLGDELATNVAGVALSGDRAAIAAGTVGGVRVWQG